MANDVRTHQVTLGCGTLILIAVIVMFFSRPGIGEIQRDIGKLRDEVGDLRRAIDAQTTQFKTLQDKLEKAKANQ